MHRKANRLVDELANYPFFFLPLGSHSLLLIPGDFDVLLRENLSGATRSRRVRI